MGIRIQRQDASILVVDTRDDVGGAWLDANEFSFWQFPIPTRQMVYDYYMHFLTKLPVHCSGLATRDDVLTELMQLFAFSLVRGALGVKYVAGREGGLHDLEHIRGGWTSATRSPVLVWPRYRAMNSFGDMSTRRDSLLLLDLSQAQGVFVLGNGLQAAEAVNFVMRTQPRLRVRLVYRTPRQLVLLDTALAATQAQLTAKFALSTTTAEKVDCVKAWVDATLKLCSPAVDASLIRYVRAFWQVLRHDPHEFFNVKQMNLYHWRSGAPLEFERLDVFDRVSFEAQEGWAVLDARNDVSANAADPQTAAAVGCAVSNPTMTFRNASVTHKNVHLGPIVNSVVATGFAFSAILENYGWHEPTWDDETAADLRQSFHLYQRLAWSHGSGPAVALLRSWCDQAGGPARGGDLLSTTVTNLVASQSPTFSDAREWQSLDWGAVAAFLQGVGSSAPALQGVHLVLAIMQRLAELSMPSRLAIWTCGALVHDSAQGATWGLARVLRLEHVAQGTCIADVPRDGSVAVISTLFGAVTEFEEMWSGCCHTARLRACDSISKRQGAIARGLHMITGGLGGLGLRAAALLMSGGAASVVLASRSGAARDVQGLEDQLQHLWGTATLVTCDSADSSSMGQLFFSRMLAGVLHAAGAAAEGLLVEAAPDSLRSICTPKAGGAWHVHKSAMRASLELVVLFSSKVSAFGYRGQSGYATSNGWLDEHAGARRCSGAQVWAVQWSTVGGAGMGAALARFAAAAGTSILGAGGISLEEYAAWLGVVVGGGEGPSVRLAHRSKPGQLLQDVPDACEKRFAELVLVAEWVPVLQAAKAVIRTAGAKEEAVENGSPMNALAPLADGTTYEDRGGVQRVAPGPLGRPEGS